MHHLYCWRIKHRSAARLCPIRVFFFFFNEQSDTGTQVTGGCTSEVGDAPAVGATSSRWTLDGPGHVLV